MNKPPHTNPGQLKSTTPWPADYSLCNLNSAAYCVNAIASWQHEQWLLTQAPSPTASNQQALADRITQLRSHLAASLLPASFVMLRRREPVGSVSLVHYSASDANLSGVWLTNMYVLPAHRNQGLAQGLLARAETYARTLQIAKLYLFTSDAQQFYLQRGWQTLKPLALPHASVEVLVRDLS